MLLLLISVLIQKSSKKRKTLAKWIIQKPESRQRERIGQKKNLQYNFGCHNKFFHLWKTSKKVFSPPAPSPPPPPTSDYQQQQEEHGVKTPNKDWAQWWLSVRDPAGIISKICRSCLCYIFDNNIPTHISNIRPPSVGQFFFCFRQYLEEYWISRNTNTIQLLTTTIGFLEHYRASNIIKLTVSNSGE